MPEENEVRAGEDWADLTLSIDQVLRLAVRWLPAITILTFLPYLLIWGLPLTIDWPGLWTAIGKVLMWTAVSVVVYIVSALVHEGLHVLAMILVGRVRVKSLHFGVRLSEGVLYVHTPDPMSARAYRIVLMLPAVALGLIPAAVGTLTGSAWMLLYGFVMLISAIGDLVVLQLMHRIPPDTPVRDHPQEIGCQVKVAAA